MELLAWAILNSNSFQGFQIFGDNTGIIKGWWTGRSWNTETNAVLRRIHELLEAHNTILTTRYVNTNHNPADGPSRGIYPASYLLLPPVDLPDEVKPFLIDFDTPLRPSKRTTPPGPSSCSPVFIIFQSTSLATSSNVTVNNDFYICEAYRHKQI